MKTAEEIRNIRKESLRNSMEQNLVKSATSGYGSYTCSSGECPWWLQKELTDKGFDVHRQSEDEYSGIRINWEKGE